MGQRHMADLRLQMLKRQLRLLQPTLSAFTCGTFGTQRCLSGGEAVGGRSRHARRVARSIQHNNRHLPIPHKTARTPVLIMPLHQAALRTWIGRALAIDRMIAEPKGSTHHFDFGFGGARGCV
jgi:hypothetical protein